MSKLWKIKEKTLHDILFVKWMLRYASFYGTLRMMLAHILCSQSLCEWDEVIDDNVRNIFVLKIISIFATNREKCI